MCVDEYKCLCIMWMLLIYGCIYNHVYTLTYWQCGYVLLSKCMFFSNIVVCTYKRMRVHTCTNKYICVFQYAFINVMLVSTPHFLKIVVEVKVSGWQHNCGWG